LKFETSNCIALSVPDRREAVRVYTKTLGFAAAKEGSNWTEIQSGALTIYIVEEKESTVCFDMLVEDVPAARVYLESAGFTQVSLSAKETFMQDPFGYVFCLTPKTNQPEAPPL